MFSSLLALFVTFICTLAGATLAPTPTPTPDPQVPYPPLCTASGPGLDAAVAGDEVYFTIQAINFFGQPLETGGADFQVTLHGM